MSRRVGSRYCRKDDSMGRPVWSYWTFSVRVWPMPWTMPPSAWMRARAGLMAMPQSTTAM